jgi:hypothetical protein
MKQADLHRAVARRTGETVERVSRMGFQLIIMPPRYPQPQPSQPTSPPVPRPIIRSRVSA